MATLFKFIFLGVFVWAAVSIFMGLLRTTTTTTTSFDANKDTPVAIGHISVESKINAWGKEYEKASLSLLSRSVLTVVTTPIFAFIAFKVMWLFSDDIIAISMAVLITAIPLFLFFIMPLLKKINKKG